MIKKIKNLRGGTPVIARFCFGHSLSNQSAFKVAGSGNGPNGSSPRRTALEALSFSTPGAAKVPGGLKARGAVLFNNGRRCMDWRVILIGIFIFSLAPGNSNAEPDEVVSRLMSKPVTAFDFGLMELEKRINLSIEQKVINGDPGYFAYVAYNKKNTKIEISVIQKRMGLPKPPVIKNRFEAKKIASEIIKPLKSLLNEGYISHCFTQLKATDVEYDVGQRLADIIELKIDLDYVGGKLRANSQLLSKEIHYPE